MAGNLKVSSEFEVVPPKATHALMIPLDEWHFVTIKIRALKVTPVSYRDYGFLLLGVAGSGIFSIVQDVSSALYWSVSVSAAVGGALCVAFSKTQSQMAQQAINEICDFIVHIEKRYERASTQSPSSAEPPSLASFIPQDLIIHSASYGRDNQNVDVTDILRAQIHGNSLEVIVSNELAGDPFPNIGKYLTVEFSFRGQTTKRILAEGEVLRLPPST
jgi:hypothetical protein